MKKYEFNNFYHISFSIIVHVFGQKKLDRQTEIIICFTIE
ncbi:hypothetical protein CLOHYLEM_04271 [[Clostridium] hylemonae DSM 15053]|uniref:Uncharacterized protein n=1 Tax=[Clostridium] hylemonae DSM 15053 TaxID=553973 RepID=C0BWT7_9FIRM|nr:hypothetical protein CLOHYLEM_04271 [[Clostridium] hylemonae DSM 15053]